MKPILIVAEAANPDWISVPLVGWSYARALREKFDVHVVTHVRNRDAILAAGWAEGEDFTAIDSEAVAGPMWKTMEAVQKATGVGWTASTAFSNLAYYYFEHLLWARFGDRIAAGDYALVHRITPLSPTTPSIIAGRCRRAGTPFMFGPINGGVPWPRQFRKTQHLEGEWLSSVRGLHRALPGYRGTRRNANAILIGSQITFGQVSSSYRDKCVYLSENAVDPARFPEPESRPLGTPLRAAFVGRLVALKGVDMLLEAAAPILRQGQLLLDIIGDGPERERLEQMTKDLDLTSSVTFAGWVDHRALRERLVQADLFPFPSIREFGGGAVLEAMALGLVPIVVDYAGPAELVSDRSGYRIPLGTRDEIIRGYRDVLRELVQDPTPLLARRTAARARVLRHFTWTAKVAQTQQVYQWVLGRAAKPDFGMPFPDEGLAPGE